MKQLQVKIIDNNTLELLEDGMKGDTINLLELQEVDLGPIQKAIEAKKDEVYNSKLQEALELAKSNYKAELEKQNGLNNTKVAELQAEIRRINESETDKLKAKENETKNLYSNKINELEKQLVELENDYKAKLEKLRTDNDLVVNNLNNEVKNKTNELLKVNGDRDTQLKLELEALQAKLDAKYNGEIVELKTKLDNKDTESKNKVESAVLAKEKEVREELSKKLEEKSKELENKQEELSKTKEELILLRNEKSATVVKNIGEELETYCNNKVEEIMQNGWFNCTWTKDNKVVKNEDDVKGSKADYIFKVFADNTKDASTELASVCLDMKDENPNSKTKKKNSDYFKALDDNRKKKNCKYAVLVSNLETDHGTIIPIIKASEYEDMYVVRPGYLINFLNMIISLTSRFKELVLEKHRHELEIKDKIALLDEFNGLKNTYLDKPLEQMKKQIEEIIKSTESISNANFKIQESCEKIKASYITNIESKLGNFELKFNKEYKKFEKKQA